MVEVADSCIDELSTCLAVHGHQAGGYHVLGPDPWQIIWNSSRDGFISFLEGRHAILGWRAPVAAVAARAGLVEQLVDHAEQVGKPLFIVLVDELTCDAGTRLGLFPTWIGTETFIDLSEWSISGGRRQKVRWARNHASGLNLEWRELDPLRSTADHEAMRVVEGEWKRERRERRTDSFQRTSFTELAEIRRYFACVDAHHVLAFCACTPMNATSWYLQDIVRRPDAPRGALEGAMAIALDTLRGDGFTIASNGPIPFWRPDGTAADRHSLGPIGRRVIRFFDRQYRFGGITQFRNKFVPDHTEPLYVLRSRRTIGPMAGASLVRLLTNKARAVR